MSYNIYFYQEVFRFQISFKTYLDPRGDQGVKDKNRSSVSSECRKDDWNGAVSRNNIKRVGFQRDIHFMACFHVPIQATTQGQPTQCL